MSAVDALDVPDFGNCEPQCLGLVCGDNGCGGTCGECRDAEFCLQGKCADAGTECVDENGRPFDGCTGGWFSGFQVNTWTELDQRRPQVAGLTNDGFVVVWESCPVDWSDYTGPSQDETGCGVFGQVYDQNGTPVGGEFQVNYEAEKNHQRWPYLAVFDGGFLVAWQSWDDEFLQDEEYEYWSANVKAYSDEGADLSKEVKLESTVTWGHNVEMVGNIAAIGEAGSIRFLLAWEAWYEDEPVRGQLLELTGQDVLTPLSEIFTLTDLTPGETGSPPAILAVDDSFLVAYDVRIYVDEDDYYPRIEARFVDASTGVAGPANEIGKAAAGHSHKPVSLGLVNGGAEFVAAFGNEAAHNGCHGVVLRRLDSAGVGFGYEYPVTSSAGDEAYLGNASLAVAEGGEILVAWQTHSQEANPDPEDVFAQVFTLLDGKDKPASDTGEIAVNYYKTGSQARPAVATAGNGFVVVWESCPQNLSIPQVEAGQDGSGCGIYGMLFQADGQKRVPGVR